MRNPDSIFWFILSFMMIVITVFFGVMSFNLKDPNAQSMAENWLIWISPFTVISIVVAYYKARGFGWNEISED